MSRSPAKSGKAIVTKSLKEKWLSIVQSAREKGENGIGGSSTVTDRAEEDAEICSDDGALALEGRFPDDELEYADL